MPIPLRQLEAQLYRVVPVTTTEIEQDDPKLRGQYVFRDESGEKFMWGPRSVRHEFHVVDTVAEADGIHFLCPLCFARNGGPAGTHQVMVTFANRNVPDEAGSRNAEGKPSRWSVVGGSTIDDLVLSPSILLDAKRKPSEGCHWHGYVGSNGVPAGSAG